MKAFIIDGPRQSRFFNVPIPEPNNNEALLKLVTVGICGSDLSLFRGENAYMEYPRIPGHEIAAQIVSVPKNDRGLSPGMLVTCNPYFNCNSCYSCRRGYVNCCQNNQTMGVQRDGAMQEYITIPVERVHDGEKLPPHLLALVEPFCISYHGVQRADVKIGDRVLIMGAGTIGVLAAIAAKRRGAQVTISDISRVKLDNAAKHFGVDYTILNDSQHSFLTQVKNITDGNGFDVAIEAVGMPETFQSCIDAAAFGGTVVLIGISARNLDFNFTMIQRKELKIFGSRNALETDFHTLIPLVAESASQLEKIISFVAPFQQADKAFIDFDCNATSTLKVLIQF